MSQCENDQSVNPFLCQEGQRPVSSRGNPVTLVVAYPGSPVNEPGRVREAIEMHDGCSCFSSSGHCSHGSPKSDVDVSLAKPTANCQKKSDSLQQCQKQWLNQEDQQKQNEKQKQEKTSLVKSPLPKWCKVEKLSSKDDGYCSSTSSPQSSGYLTRSNGRLEALEAEIEEPQISISPPHAGSPVAVDDERDTWDQKADFLLSIIGFAVDLANVWRFPYLCYKNGGGAFLIPYILMLLFGAMPLFYMELVLGQYNRQGPVSVWKICPIFKGVGLCSVLVAFYASFYYNVIIGWSFFFLYSSFSAELPWLRCNNTWNSIDCWDGFTNTTESAANKTGPSAAMEYFERGVLEIHLSEGVHNLGSPRWQLAISLLLVYIVLYFALFKGVKSSGKVVWVTATMPYLILSILLIRGSLLPGAGEGIIYFLNPDLSRLSQSQVWVDAAVQIFYSVGAGFGVHLSYASYNTFNNNCYRDCLITTVVNSFTSFFSGFVIFTYLGYMAQKQSVPINKVATEGPGLVFQVYPEAIATLPGSQFWAVLFFFMLVTLGMDSSMGGLECVITGLLDEFRSFFRRWRYSREVFTGIVVIASFSIALVNVTRGGGYMFHWFDTYSAGISLLSAALFEAIAVAWFYGLNRFSSDIEEMLNFRPGIFWRVCWKFISPAFLITVIACAIIFKEPLKYNQYVYPQWVEILGWIFGLSSVAMIPIWIVIYMCKGSGSFKERLAIGISPEKDSDAIRRTGVVKRFTLKHWVEI